MTLKPIKAIPGGTALAPALGVEDNDSSGAATGAVDLDIYIDGVNGSDSNNGLSKSAPLATLAGYFAMAGTNLPVGSTIRVHLAGTGGADPWVTPATPQVYDQDVIILPTGGFFSSALVFRGPQNMVPATLATGPTSGVALDPVPARVVDETGAANPAGYRTELLFTAVPPVPLWTAHDLGPRAKGAFVRIRRGADKRYFELPIADNTTNTIIVDSLNIVGDLLATDTVEIVVPGAEIRGATVFGGMRGVVIYGDGGCPIAVSATDQGFTFERLKINVRMVLARMVSFDRCQFVSAPGGFEAPGGLEALSVSQGGSAFVQLCSAIGRGPQISVGGRHIDFDILSRPDSASDPSAAMVNMPTVALMTVGPFSISSGVAQFRRVLSAYGSPAAGIDVRAHGTLEIEAACPYVGGDNNTTTGIRARTGAIVHINTVARTKITGAGGDLDCDGTVVAYGAYAAAPLNNRLHATTIAAGSPLGSMSLIYG